MLWPRGTLQQVTSPPSIPLNSVLRPVSLTKSYPYVRGIDLQGRLLLLKTPFYINLSARTAERVSSHSIVDFAQAPHHPIVSFNCRWLFTNRSAREGLPGRHYQMERAYVFEHKPVVLNGEDRELLLMDWVAHASEVSHSFQSNDQAAVGSSRQITPSSFLLDRTDC